MFFICNFSLIDPPTIVCASLCAMFAKKIKTGGAGEPGFRVRVWVRIFFSPDLPGYSFGCRIHSRAPFWLYSSSPPSKNTPNASDSPLYAHKDPPKKQFSLPAIALFIDQPIAMHN